MEKLQFSLSINAPKQKVWSTLWNDDTYRKWTSAFSETSYAKTDWQQGSKVLFIDAKNSGMVSIIETNKPYDVMVFSHQGIVKDGVEDTESEAVKGWKGATEKYTLTETNNHTELVVEMDCNDEMKAYFNKTFPKALDQVKIIAES